MMNKRDYILVAISFVLISLLFFCSMYCAKCSFDIYPELTKDEAFGCGAFVTICLYLIFKSIHFFFECVFELLKIRKERAQNDCINLDSSLISNYSNGSNSDSNDCNS